MTTSVKTVVLPPILLSSSLFCLMTFPLALLGSKPIEIQLQKEPIFAGQLKDVAAPYLGFVSAISFGAGVATLALTGWRRSTYQKHQTQQQLFDLHSELKTKEAQLDELKCSDSRLKAEGLQCFLEDAVKIPYPVVADSTHQVPLRAAAVTTNRSVAVETSRPVARFLVILDQPTLSQPIVLSSTTLPKAIASWAMAQTYLGFAQRTSQANQSATTTSVALTPSLELPKPLKRNL